MRKYKTVKESLTEQVHIVMPEHINPAGRLFGGKLLEWIDIVAAVVARRHCDMSVTTAGIDNLSFKAPAYLNDMLIMKGRVTHTGRTSMEIKVDTYVEGINKDRVLVNTAYFVMVGVDADGKNAIIPEVIAETHEEKNDFEAARRRYEQRKLNKI